MTEDTDWRDDIHFLGGIFGPLLVLVGWLFLDARGLVLPLPATMVTFWVIISIMVCSAVRTQDRREVFWGILNTWRRWLTALIFLWPGLLWVAVIDTLVSLLTPSLRWWFAPDSRRSRLEQGQSFRFIGLERKLIKARHWLSKLFKRPSIELSGPKLSRRLTRQIEDGRRLEQKLKRQLEVYQDGSLPNALTMRQELERRLGYNQETIERLLELQSKLAKALESGPAGSELLGAFQADSLQTSLEDLIGETEDYLEASRRTQQELETESQS